MTDLRSIGPSGVQLEPDTLESLDAVDHMAKRLKSLGTFDPDVQDLIRSKFLPTRISDTLRIEGIRVSPRITRSILEGLAVSEMDRYTETEILNIDAAHNLIDAAVQTERDLDSEFIRELHHRATKDLIPSAGSFRDNSLTITGSQHVPPPWADVPDQINEIVEAVQNSGRVHAIVVACWLHARFTAIHPFVDGNGRVGRLIQDYVLTQGRLLPVGIPLKRREEYYDALALADEGKLNDLIRIVAQAELEALEKAIRIAEAPKLRRETIATMVAAAEAAARRTEFSGYELWRRHVNHIVEEFEDISVIFNEHAETFDLKLRRHEEPSFETWREIEMGEAGERAGWIFELTLSRSDRPLYQLLMWAGLHDSSRVFELDGGADEGVVLFVSGADPGHRYRYEGWADPSIALRELVPAGGELVAYRDSRDARVRLDVPDELSIRLERSDRWIPEGVTAGDVAQEVVGDLLAKFGLV